MLYPADDSAKRRLTERSELKVAVEFLVSRGFRDDEIAVQLSRFYYVDIDELNHVVASIPRGSPPLGLIWKSVA